MKRITLLLLLAGIIAVSCSKQENEAADQKYTGREVTYSLYQASDYPTSGKIVFKELTGGKVEVDVQLSGTEGDATHPVHLHYGNLQTVDAGIAANFNDVKASTGLSETVVTNLNDDTPLTFEKIENFDGSVKVHLAATGPGEEVILAAGNIGINKGLDSGREGRVSVTVCKSE